MKHYRRCQIVRERGPARYFGQLAYFRNLTKYRRVWWRVTFPDATWTLCGTLAEARACIDRVGPRHGAA